VSEGGAAAKDTVILFTSDVHSSVDSGWTYSGIDVIRKQLIAKGDNVILVDNGDSIQGEPLATMTTGSANIELMNQLGYDIAIMGNHEFDYGMERFMELVKMADFPYISCNFNKLGELVFDPYIIKDIDGTKIAFVGITTPWAIKSSTPQTLWTMSATSFTVLWRARTGKNCTPRFKALSMMQEKRARSMSSRWRISETKPTASPIHTPMYWEIRPVSMF
jgi:hypothetical protein